MLRLAAILCVVLAGCAGEIVVERAPDATVTRLVDLTTPIANDMVNVVDQSASPDLTGTFVFKDWMPDKKGIWIWYWDYIGETPAVAAQKCKDLGIGWVLIKSGQDADYWSDRFNAAAISEFTSRGIRVLGWPYMTPASIAGSITAAVTAATIPGVDGLVLDVEVEWQNGGDHSADAEQLCKGIRAGAPNAFLAYTSFGWVGLHGTFPFKAFDQFCGDAFFPQVYFSDRGVAWNDPTKGLPGALAQYAAAKLNAPLWIAGSNDDIAGSSPAAGPTTADLNSFMDAAGARTSLWEFPGTQWPAKLTQLASLHWAN